MSLVPVTPNTISPEVQYWRLSTNLGGSPGTDDPTNPTEGSISHPLLEISEIFISPTNPKIEFYNPSNVPCSLSQWIISMDPFWLQLIDGIVPENSYFSWENASFQVRIFFSEFFSLGIIVTSFRWLHCLTEKPDSFRFWASKMEQGLGITDQFFLGQLLPIFQSLILLIRIIPKYSLQHKIQP